MQWGDVGSFNLVLLNDAMNFKDLSENRIRIDRNHAS